MYGLLPKTSVLSEETEVVTAVYTTPFSKCVYVGYQNGTIE